MGYRVTEDEVREKLENFASALGLKYYPFSENIVGKINEEFISPPNALLEVDISTLFANYRRLQDTLSSLLDYLDLEIKKGPQISKKGKVKNNAKIYSK